MADKSALIFLSFFVCYIFMIHHAFALDKSVESILKRLEDVEANVKENTELKNEIERLKWKLNRHSVDLKNSEEHIITLDRVLETLMKGQTTLGKLKPANKRTGLKIEKGQDTDSKVDISTRHVTGPIAFMAYMKHFHTSQQYPPGAILPFEMTSLNTGNAYNKTSGLFTCPTSGLYKLDWALAFYVQNDTDAETEQVEGNREYTLDVDFVIVYLNKNDTAGVTNPDDNGLFMPYLSKFSGFRISE